MGDTTDTTTTSTTTDVVATQPIQSPGSDTLGLIERAEKATKILQDTEARLDQKRAEIESIVARQMLSGKANAGQVMKTAEQLRQETIDNQVKEFTKRFL